MNRRKGIKRMNVNEVNGLKVFRIDDYDWVCAKSKEEAIEWYLEETGVSEEDINDIDDIVECDLDKNNMFIDEEHTKKITFRESLESGEFLSNTTPCIFCTTEY